MNAVKQSELLVLVSVRIEPASERATRSRADAAAVALAQKALGAGSEPRLCTAGDMPDRVARDYLAQGVSTLTRLRLRGDAQAADTVSLLESDCRDCPLVLAGSRAESGLASGLLPYALARRLQRPLINEVVDLVREPDGGWRVVQALPRGARRSWRLDPGVAAVLVTSTRLQQREDLPLRHSWAAAEAGRIVDSRLDPPASQPDEHVDWTFEAARKLRRPLAPVSAESGAARMARATGTAESTRSAAAVIREGSATEKARLLLDHLRKLSLVHPSPP